jgi:hypothetical protein
MREKQALTVKAFDTLTSSLSINITAGKWMDRSTAEGLSRELRDLVFAVGAEAFMRRRYQRCKFIVEASTQVAEWEQHSVPDADFPGLTRELVRVIAQPI